MPRSRAPKKKKIPKLKLTRVQELNALYRLMEISQAGHAFAGTLEMIAIDISLTTGFPFVAIEEVDAASQTLQIKAANGFDPPEGICSSEKTMAGAVAASGKPVAQKDPADEFWKGKGIRSYYGFPLMAGKHCVGALSLAHTEEVEMDANLEKWASGTASFVASFLQWNRMSETILREKRKPAAVEVLPEPQPAAPPVDEASTNETRAGQDHVTQLPNAELFRFLLSQALARARRGKDIIAVLSLDLDHFEDFKAASGEEAANNVVKQVADRLKRNIREGDAVARWSEDEFIWLISSLQNMDGVAMIAEKMLAVIKRPVMAEGKEYKMTTSIGISLYPSDGGDAETLIKHAQMASIRSKELGTDTYHFYTDEVNSKVFEQLNLKRQLREGLDRHEFVLHYQPIVETDTGKIDGVEAFVRWQNPDGVLTYPDEFVRLSEDTGLITLLDQWVLKTACEQVRHWESISPRPLRVSVNLSGRLFGEEDFLERIVETITQTGIRPDRLELELTEQTIMENPERSADFLGRLHEIGVAVAIDNFGTSGFSLSHLKQFPISTLKIDANFVRDSVRDPQSPSLASAIIPMAHALNIRVVAKGIEKDAELNLLRSDKCDCYQGNLFSPPMGAASFEEVLRKHAPKPAAPKVKKVEEHMPWPVSAASETAPAKMSSVRKQADPEHLPWPVSAALVESDAPVLPKPAPAPPPKQKASTSMFMAPSNLERLPDALKYIVSCYNCRNKFDALETTWCSCLTSERTFVCPSCLKCFCRSTLEYKIDFWAEAPRTLWQRRVAEEAEYTVMPSNPSVEAVKRPLVLVADDELPILLMAAHAVEGLGFSVIVASNGEEALQLAKTYRPDAILSDALMPKMDGREMCRQIKHDPELKNIKVIIMSSLYYSGKQRSGAFREFQIDEYLQKPVDFYILKGILDKLMP